jgi:hypothetical protein
LSQDDSDCGLYGGGFKRGRRENGKDLVRKVRNITEGSELFLRIAGLVFEKILKPAE